MFTHTYTPRRFKINFSTPGTKYNPTNVDDYLGATYTYMVYHSI